MTHWTGSSDSRCALIKVVGSDVMSTSVCTGLNLINHLTSNEHYNGRTAPLTSKRWILYIYSTNIGTEYFKHGIYSPFLSLQNADCFIILTYLVPVLFTFYIQGVLKWKKIIPTVNYIRKLFRRFDVCVTVHHWYNNRNRQLEGTIILLIISISSTCFGR